MRIKQILAATAVLTIGSSFAMAQASDKDCNSCLLTQFHTYKECDGIPLTVDVTITPKSMGADKVDVSGMTESQKVCLCKMFSSFSITDACTSQCSADAMQKMKLSFEIMDKDVLPKICPASGAPGTGPNAQNTPSGTNAQNSPNNANGQKPPSGASHAVPKTGAALIVAATAAIFAL